MYFFQPNTLVGAQEEIVNFVSEEKHTGFFIQAPATQGQIHKY